MLLFLQGQEFPLVNPKTAGSGHLPIPAAAAVCGAMELEGCLSELLGRQFLSTAYAGGGSQSAQGPARNTDRVPVPSLQQQPAGEGRTGNDFIAADGTHLLGEYSRMEETHRSQISYSLHNVDVLPVSIFSLSSLPTVREELR